MPLRKIVVGIGLLLLLAGLPVLVFPAQEADTETVKIGKWDLQSLVLAPYGQDQDSTFHARLMNSSRWFQLNLSSSDPIGLQVSISRQGLEKVPIFNQTRTSFNQKVSASATGTYVIDIQNKNPSSVTLDGNVLEMQLKTNYRTVYPYALLGFLMILGGTGVLIFGILRNPKKPSKSKRARLQG